MVTAVVFFLLLSLGVTVVLYLAIQAETRDLPRMSREEAERQAREDGPRDERP